MNDPWYEYGAPPNGPSWTDAVQALERKLKELEERLDTAEKKLAELESKPPLHVEYHFDQLKVSRLDGTLNIGLSPQAMKDVGSFEVPAPGMWTVPKAEAPEGGTPVPGFGAATVPGSASVPGPAPVPGSGAAPVPGSASALGASPVPGSGAAAAPGASAPGGTDAALAIRALQQEAFADFDRNGAALLQSLCGQMGVELDEQHRRLIVADIRAQLGPRVHYYARTAPFPANGSVDERRQWRRTVLDKTGRDVRIALSNYLRNFQLPHIGKEDPST